MYSLKCPSFPVQDMIRYLEFPAPLLPVLSRNIVLLWFWLVYPTMLLLVGNLEAAMQFSKSAMIGLGYQ